MSDMMATKRFINDVAVTATRGVLLVVLLLLGGVVSAQQGAIRLEHKAEQWQSVTDENGVETMQLVEASNVVPGEKVLFTVTYINTGDQPAEDVTITNPVPRHMVYVDDSAAGENTSILFSADGGESFATASDLLVRSSDGTQRPAGASDYTHVRWIIRSDVASGTSGTVQFMATVK